MSLRQNAKAPKATETEFSYQSECHCAKTSPKGVGSINSLVTSQNVTAPKLPLIDVSEQKSLVTSQNVTAPKQDYDGQEVVVV